MRNDIYELLQLSPVSPTVQMVHIKCVHILWNNIYGVSVLFPCLIVVCFRLLFGFDLLS